MDEVMEEAALSMRRLRVSDQAVPGHVSFGRPAAGGGLFVPPAVRRAHTQQRR